jgi:signal transduction histidine kinase
VVIVVHALESVRLRADRSRVRQVINNLVDNAVKYTAAGGRVDIKVSRSGDWAVLRVEDEGVGISAEELPQIWNRLYRGDKSRSQRGLGLGLSLVKAVVHAHQGRIDVDSSPGLGSIFTVYLPLSPGA